MDECPSCFSMGGHALGCPRRNTPWKFTATRFEFPTEFAIDGPGDERVPGGAAHPEPRFKGLGETYGFPEPEEEDTHGAQPRLWVDELTKGKPIVPSEQHLSFARAVTGDVTAALAQALARGDYWERKYEMLLCRVKGALDG